MKHIPPALTNESRVGALKEKDILPFYDKTSSRTSHYKVWLLSGTEEELDLDFSTFLGMLLISRHHVSRDSRETLGGMWDGNWAPFTEKSKQT